LKIGGLMDTPVVLLLVVGIILAAIALFVLWRRNKKLVETYAPIIDARSEVRRAREEAQRLRSEAVAEVALQKREKERLAGEYVAGRALYDKLRAEIDLLEENVEAIAVGLYKPHYDYDSSTAYREAQDALWAKQKEMVKAGKAVVSAKAWQVQGDSRAGERMTKQYLKLILRAFNGECDAAIARVSWNNVTKMEERIRKTCEAINELGGVMEMRITREYLELKLAELRLEYETERKKREEQEEQRRIKEQMREEERALREAEKAKLEAEEEEARYENALEKARAELAKAKGDSLELLQQKIQQLDAALHKAHELKERATSMAQLTRSGHVYVVSNVGSFGENVFKIGMTRRLEPLDRVKELGDASVPFDFDVHAMIYCEDAPSLECEFQTRFQERAINLVNPRKEFFAVSIDDIQGLVRERGLNVELTKLAEARDYRETLALRAERALRQVVQPPQISFPTTLETLDSARGAAATGES
jgi:LPXTG-motif cell wall-anchored protein